MVTIDQQRIDKVIHLLVELSRGNFSERAQIDDEDDFVNTVLSGLNMLSEELSFYQKELEQKNTLLQDTLHNISEIVYALRIEPDTKEISYEFVSPRVKLILGYEEADIYRDPQLWFNAIHPEYRRQFSDTIDEVLAGKEMVCSYKILSKQAGTYIWLEDHFIPKLTAGQPVTQIFSSARNITGRKRAAEEREQMIVELNNKYNELMQFNYIVSHNLRAPVASILGAASVLQLPLSNDEKNDVTARIMETADTLDMIIKDLNLLLSSKSKLNEKFESFSLTEVTNSIMALFEQKIIAANAVVSVSIDTDADNMHSIRSYIYSAVYNMLSNALKYTRTDIQPDIRVRSWASESIHYIEVSDNGIGIDMEKHGHSLFGFYKRLHMEYEGKGLGLHMTKAQIESLNGNIECISQQGMGCKFIISLPRAK